MPLWTRRRREPYSHGHLYRPRPVAVTVGQGCWFSFFLAGLPPTWRVPFSRHYYERSGKRKAKKTPRWWFAFERNKYFTPPQHSSGACFLAVLYRILARYPRREIKWDHAAAPYVSRLTDRRKIVTTNPKAKRTGGARSVRYFMWRPRRQCHVSFIYLSRLHSDLKSLKWIRRRESKIVQILNSVGNHTVFCGSLFVILISCNQACFCFKLARQIASWQIRPRTKITNVVVYDLKIKKEFLHNSMWFSRFS